MESHQVEPAVGSHADAIKAIENGVVPNAHKRKVSIKETDAESCVSERGTEVRESDFKKRQVGHVECNCKSVLTVS